MFWHFQAISVRANNKRIYFCIDGNDWMEGSHLPHYWFLNQKQKHQDIYCNNLPHMTTLENLISLSGKSHIMVNALSLARCRMGSPYGNTTSLYLEKNCSSFNSSTDTLVNSFALFFIYISLHLHQWLSDSWYVPVRINILQPHIVWLRWVIFHTFGVITNHRAEPLIRTSPFSSYTM